MIAVIDLSEGAEIERVGTYPRSAWSAHSWADPGSRIPNCPKEYVGRGWFPVIQSFTGTAVPGQSQEKTGSSVDLSGEQVVDDYRWVWPSTPVAELIKTKLAGLNEVFRQHADAGTVVDGETIATTHPAVQEIREVHDSLVDETIEPPQKALTRSGVVLDIDIPTAAALLSAVRTHRSSCQANEATHATAIHLLTTAEEVFGYDITTGWPV